MRIHKTSTESHHEITSSKGKTDKGDRFSKILGVKRKESHPEFNLLAEDQSPGMPAATGQPESISGVRVSTDVERLAAEIVDHISSHQANGARSVEIQFNSQTLEGLRVIVRSDRGAVAVSFLTPVARVAGLLQKNLENLRSALESKGVRVAHLAVNRRMG